MNTQKQGNQSNQGSSNRGFAGMDEERQREISSMGGKAAHASGHAHEFTSQEARVAGAKGGAASHGGRSSGSSAKTSADDEQSTQQEGKRSGNSLASSDRESRAASSQQSDHRSAGSGQGRSGAKGEQR